MGKKNLTKLVVAGIIFVVVCSLIPLYSVQADVPGGGEITNTVPDVISMTGTEYEIGNEGATSENFTGTVKDVNGEQDILFVNWTTTYDATKYSASKPGGGWVTSKPGSGAGINTDGICVWNVTPLDGILNYQARHTWIDEATPGEYTQTITATDEVGSGTTKTNITKIASVKSVTFEVVTKSNVTADPQKWSFGSVEANDTNVGSVNYLRANNTGTAATTITISIPDFGNIAAYNLGFENITVTSNIQFKYNTTTDNTNTSAWNDTCSGVLSTINIPKGGYLFIAYRIVQIPAVMYEGDYTCTIAAEFEG